MNLSRRKFLLAGLAAPAVLGRQSPDPSILLDRGFARVSRIADGLYVTIADPQKGRQCLSNGGVLAQLCKATLKL
jgi:hypothetical protein